jgi:taurine dioxygenase
MWHHVGVGPGSRIRSAGTTRKGIEVSNAPRSHWIERLFQLGYDVEALFNVRNGGRGSMRLRSLHPDFGVEVLDFDLHRNATAAQIDELRAAVDEHQLLLIRGCGRVSPDRHVEICSWFGPPMDTGTGSLCSVLQNEDAAGSMKLPFHADFTYTDFPIRIITLQAIDVPPDGTTTSFASGIRGWATLPGDLQEMLAPMTLRHRHVGSKGVPADWPVFFADHPIRKPHPRTGRPILFVTEHHADWIHEMDPPKSREMLRRLFDHLYDPAHIYTHRWQLNDFVVLDNLAVQHARIETADLAKGKRALQRVAVNEVSLADLIARARQRVTRLQAA